MRLHSAFLAAAFSLSLVTALGCSSDSSPAAATPQTDAEWKADVTAKMHASLLGDIDTLIAAAKEIQAAAPAGRGWDAAQDKAALDKMKAAWIKGRVAYEHVEGALAPLFPEIDASMDARYEDFLDELGGKGDPDAFDGEGVTGMHAIERILWSAEVPAAVTERESTELQTKGYKAPAFPANDAEATNFSRKLVQRLIDDATKLQGEWKPQKIDVSGAFTGLVSLMNEQLEKVNKASSSEEESRYSQRTMADIRANLEGTENVYKLFQPWLRTKDAATDAKILAGFERLKTAYAAVQGDAIPQPPATWKAEEPDQNSQADKDSPFGKLFFAVRDAVEMKKDVSVVASMNLAAKKLGFEEFAEEK